MSTMDVRTVSEIAMRYMSIVDGLTTAIGEIAPQVGLEHQLVLRAALLDARAQVVATVDMLERAERGSEHGGS